MAEGVKLDLGCGKNKKAGFIGVDSIAFDGVDVVLDLCTLKDGVEEWRVLLRPTEKNCDIFKPWPWEDGTVEEVYSSHSFEHFNRIERVHFWNELYRILKTGGKCQVIVPHHGSSRAYGDLTHEWPAVGEFHFYYLDKNWRDANAPHDAFMVCDFQATWGYSVHPSWQVRSQESQMFALGHYREVAQDLICTVTKR